jgi:hypothetical protein
MDGSSCITTIRSTPSPIYLATKAESPLTELIRWSGLHEHTGTPQ